MKLSMKNVMSTETIEQEVQLIMVSESTKSGKMKQLFMLGLEVKDIAKLMEVRYNFVYNVVSNMINMEGLLTENNRGTSKKDIVFGMLDEGKSVKEICIDLKMNTNYVYKIKKEWVANVQEEVKEEELKVEKDIITGTDEEKVSEKVSENSQFPRKRKTNKEK